jgi:hypothetical protein
MFNTFLSGGYERPLEVHCSKGISPAYGALDSDLRTYYHLAIWEEVLGHLHRIEEPQEGCLVALIGKIHVALPEEMAARLLQLQGQRIGIIRTEQDYRIRVIDGKR